MTSLLHDPLPGGAGAVQMMIFPTKHQKCPTPRPRVLSFAATTGSIPGEGC